MFLLFFKVFYSIMEKKTVGEVMYLKQIKAQGFKSFADKISIELGSGITGIVGPNGSGKSNVVDAVRWVLGEQSVKSLRGEGAMTDVIFSGSKSRNGLNVASVSLVFDNNDQYLPINYNEVAIKRRVYQDGTNEYFINNERCRLKDIVDLLMDSGIGKESFNIISQGKIDEILSNKPEERRTIFEEAAGVLKYKKRKIDALHKLERTHDNMNRVNDIIHELELQVEPLKQEKEKALKYRDIQTKLENLEISLITSDVTKLNDTYQKNKKRIDELNREIVEVTTKNTTNEVALEEFRQKNNLLNQKITEKQTQLMEATKKEEQENSRKQILLERKKYEVEDAKLHDNMISLKEKVETIESEYQNEVQLLEQIKKESFHLEEEKKKMEGQIALVRKKKQELETKLSTEVRKQSVLENKIVLLKEAIEHNSTLPYAIRNVLENPKLRGIHNVIGNLIEVEEQYATAISVALGASSSFLVVDNETCAKEAIQYLKTSNIGRATFFPLNVIKPKGIDLETKELLKNVKGYIATAEELLKYDPKYRSIITNQLGNVIVAQTIDDANEISRKIGYRYKIVTIDGELIHIGGSLTGGNSKTRNTILDKYELEQLLKEKKEQISLIQLLEDKINQNDTELKNEEDKYYLKNRDAMNCGNDIKSKEQTLLHMEDELKKKKEELESVSHLLNHTLSKEEEEVIHSYYEAVNEKNRLQNELNSLLKDRENLNENMEEFESLVKKDNTQLNSKNKELKELEIEVNRADVKLDTLLNALNETYGITYEKAKETYLLEIDASKARNEVSNLKRDLKEMGIVNLNAPEEYDKVSERYEFLNSQKEDLNRAENTLLEIIEQLDQVMKEEFSKTFEIIRKNFQITFKELFKGGQADLRLTDPKNMLETGVEIVASPPGKKLTTISLLSGGEKTFTAISLLFAILKSRPVPFCILDEVEAALDEVNVDSFGKYLNSLKQNTQFILITHKKKTMEYADVLYGITMQESGVSKLVSVKLEEIKV